MTSFGLYFKGMSKADANAMRKRLNEIAAGFGYTSERGPTTGEGNAAEMLTAIDSGELALVLLADEQRALLMDWLNEQASQVDDISLQEAIQSVSRQLFAALKRERQAEWDEMFDEEEIHQDVEETHSS